MRVLAVGGNFFSTKKGPGEAKKEGRLKNLAFSIR
jgi:hypothetical protein